MHFNFLHIPSSHLHLPVYKDVEILIFIYKGGQRCKKRDRCVTLVFYNHRTCKNYFENCNAVVSLWTYFYHVNVKSAL